ncbi:8-oxo-dGTP diphosphatase [Pyrobaculum aerophilum]|uniref:Oxidized purine nucleoside triphosphate hydrolase n=2 Tax=Pyrobaculum aerophilum TaxID=13773 RepID=Q8ZVJ4_PYRAE|nr:MULTISPECIES: 8-oxo-dGTP diphosphatase [Pyrobaculum]AAL64062.1 mutT/nudix family protein [Pyrobaculum aerophilum str. IM2]MCX8135808.1 8-oxo-dGTP diphosphatase [Pyrobaculum aerophilum]RFA97274.1 8-oxo-dGTP diphosphatase [Pyrobaculum aerophilum]RFB00128.1 8-oxo-dGTP diphosphatase [Pyrobaculum aerophilum]HII47174.1 8-oxo-dGTP diphosphatase [Pyrobaculum aerophilum]
MISLETLLYLIQGERVLLILKKRGLGKGLFNGVGGKVKPGETPEQAVVREAEEEIGVKPIQLSWRGLLEFWNLENGQVESIHYVHVYVSEKYVGEPRESDEAAPLWFEKGNIPYDRMWEDDRLWLPVVLDGKRVYGKFEFEDWKLRKWIVYLLQQTG